MDTYIGISGWRYAPWRGDFYPKGLVQKKELYYASRQLRTIEINGTFYSLQRPTSFQRWYDETPDDFCFSVKCPRYITHIKRLKDVQAPLGSFFASGVLHLKEKLGPFLWQFPPSFLFKDDIIEDFFKILPGTVGEAIEVSKWTDRLTPDFPRELVGSHKRLRHAMEIRNQSFENPDFIELLRKYDIALVFADTAGKWPYMEDITSDFVYLRLHGDVEIYKSGYDDATLRWWADRIKLWRQGRQPQDALTISDQGPPVRPRDVYVYFDNDIKVRAPYDAKGLADFLTVH